MIQQSCKQQQMTQHCHSMAFDSTFGTEPMPACRQAWGSMRLSVEAASEPCPRDSICRLPKHCSTQAHP
jgi:hypothetical protein